MTFLDFFAGIGTIRLGFEQAGWTCNGHVEWDKYAQKSYNAMHEIKDGEYCGWDIREVRAAELPRSDLWTFGAPCQDFSIAGNRKGMDGERSSLVNEIFRLIEETPEEDKPQWLLYENVKGMLSSNGGWDFLGIILEMDELGYDVEWQLLNTKDFGIPQNRERVFTIGHLRGRGGRKVFPITGQSGQTGGEIISQSGLNVIGNVGKTGHGSFNVYSAHGICPTLKASGYKGPVMVILDDQGGAKEPPNEIKQIGNISHHNQQTGRVYDPSGIAPCLTTMQGGAHEPKIAIPCLTPDRIEKRQNGRRFKEDGDPMFTLTAQDKHGISNGIRIRKLTPLECWRLQGVPDEYFHKAKAAGVSDSQLYKQAGNACTVNVMYAIAMAMKGTK